MGVVTISRQYGAGGQRVAPPLAEALGYRLVDRELVEEAARRLGLDPVYARARDERAPAMVEEVGMALAAGTPEVAMGSRGVDDWALAATVRAVTESLADAGGYVILGRGGQCILRGRADAFHLALVAELHDRVRRVAEWNGVSEREARRRCEHGDAERGAYVRRFFGADIRDPLLYDCTLNVSRLGIAGTVDAAVSAARRKLGQG